MPNEQPFIPLPTLDTIRTHPFFQRLITLESLNNVQDVFTNEEAFKLYNMRWDYLHGLYSDAE